MLVDTARIKTCNIIYGYYLKPTLAHLVLSTGCHFSPYWQKNRRALVSSSERAKMVDHTRHPMHSVNPCTIVHIYVYTIKVTFSTLFVYLTLIQPENYLIWITPTWKVQLLVGHITTVWSGWIFKSTRTNCKSQEWSSTSPHTYSISHHALLAKAPPSELPYEYHTT